MRNKGVSDGTVRILAQTDRSFYDIAKSEIRFGRRDAGSNFTGNVTLTCHFLGDTTTRRTFSPAFTLVDSQVRTMLRGNGQITKGPYKLQLSWGLGFEFLLNGGENLTLTTDHTKVVGDGSTRKLFLDVDRVTPNNSDVTWNLQN